MMNRAQALAELRRIIEIGHRQRDLFVEIVVTQDDWLGALGNVSSRHQAARLEAAQMVQMMLLSRPEMDIPTASQIINAQLVAKPPKDELERAKHAALMDLIGLFESNIPLK